MREEPWTKIIICRDKHSESQELSSKNIFCQVYVLLNSQVVKKLSSLYEYLVVVNVWFTAVSMSILWSMNWWYILQTQNSYN